MGTRAGRPPQRPTQPQSCGRRPRTPHSTRGLRSSFHRSLYLSQEPGIQSRRALGCSTPAAAWGLCAGAQLVTAARGAGQAPGACGAGENVRRGETGAAGRQGQAGSPQLQVGCVRAGGGRTVGLDPARRPLGGRRQEAAGDPGTTGLVGLAGGRRVLAGVTGAGGSRGSASGAPLPPGKGFAGHTQAPLPPTRGRGRDGRVPSQRERRCCSSYVTRCSRKPSSSMRPRFSLKHSIFGQPCVKFN